jgi:hypothetical protein
MLRSRRTVHWTLAHLWLACAVLAACATPQRSSSKDLRLDSETAAKVTHASAIIEGASPMASTATAAVASTLGQAVPALLALLENDNAVGELEEQLVECARLAERQINSRFFGHRSPTRQECGEEVFVDGLPLLPKCEVPRDCQQGRAGAPDRPGLHPRAVAHHRA